MSNWVTCWAFKRIKEFINCILCHYWKSITICTGAKSITMVYNLRGCVGFEWPTQCMLTTMHAYKWMRRQVSGIQNKVPGPPTPMTLPPPGGPHCSLALPQRPAAGPWCSQRLVPPLSQQLHWAPTPPCRRRETRFSWYTPTHSLGSISNWFGVGTLYQIISTKSDLFKIKYINITNIKWLYSFSLPCQWKYGRFRANSHY